MLRDCAVTGSGLSEVLLTSQTATCLLLPLVLKKKSAYSFCNYESNVPFKDPHKNQTKMGHNSVLKGDDYEYFLPKFLTQISNCL